MSKTTFLSWPFWQKTKRRLTARRTVLAGTYGEYLLVILALLAITIVFTDFVAFDLFNSVFTSGPGDATAGFLWLNFADHSLSPFVPKLDWTNYPDGQYMVGFTFVTYLLLWLPLRALSFIFGPVASLNLFTLIGFVSAGTSMYWLMKRLTRSWMVAFFAAYAAAFVPYAIMKGSTHLAYIFSYVFVLMLAGFMALWLRPTRLRAVLLGIVIAIAFYTDGYFILLSSVFMMSMLLAGSLYSVVVRMPVKDFWLRIKMLCLTAIVFIAAIAPIGIVQLTQGGQIRQTLSESRPDIGQEIRAYRSNVIDFILPASSHPAFEDNPTFKALHNYKNQRSNGSENLNYIAFTLMVLLAAGGILLAVWLLAPRYSSIRKLAKPMQHRYILLGAITVITLPICVAFMFSPEVSVLGHTIPLPGKLFIDHNLALWRVMSRFFVLLHVVVVAFAAFTLWLIMKQVEHRKRFAGIAMVVLCFVMVAFEYASAPNRPSFSFTSLPPVYAWLAQQKDVKVVAEFPIVDQIDQYHPRYFTAQVVHKKKLVNKKESDITRLSNAIGTIDNPEAIDWAYRRGAQVIVSYDAECKNKAWGRLIYSQMQRRQWCVYRLERPATDDAVFVRFDKGFSYITTVRPNGAKVAVRDSRAIMRFMRPDLTTPAKGRVELSADIVPYGYLSMKGSWRLSQGKAIVASGHINGSRTKIEVTAKADEPLVLEVGRDDGLPLLAEDVKLESVIVSQIEN